MKKRVLAVMLAAGAAVCVSAFFAGLQIRKKKKKQQEEEETEDENS